MTEVEARRDEFDRPRRPDNGKPFSHWSDRCYAYWGWHFSLDMPAELVEASAREVDRIMERRLGSDESRW